MKKDLIIQTVLEYYDLDESILNSATRKGEESLARFMICSLLKEYTTMKPRQIGRVINRDRSSVHTALKSLGDLMAGNRYIYKDYQQIENNFIMKFSEVNGWVQSLVM